MEACLAECGDSLAVLPGGNQFLRLLEMLLVLLAFLLLLLRLFGFFFLRRLAVGSGLVSLRLELRHVGDQSRHLLYRPGDGLQESRVQFLRQSALRMTIVRSTPSVIIWLIAVKNITVII